MSHADVSVVIAAPLSCLSHSFLLHHAFAFFFFNLDTTKIKLGNWIGEEGEFVSNWGRKEKKERNSLYAQKEKKIYRYGSLRFNQTNTSLTRFLHILNTIIFDLPYSLQSIEDASGSVAQ